MAFNTAITGIKASQIELDVTGSNIANASTVGYKSSRTEFGDIYTTVALGAGSTNTTGSGVTVTDIAQNFSAGTIEFTNSNLDLAIDGSGFFMLDDGQGGVTYSRSGGFELDKDGNVVNKSGKFLQGYGLDSGGNQLPVGNLQVSEKENPPNATDNVDLSFNIDSREDPTDLLRPYDPTDSATFTYSTTLPTYDSLGNENTIKVDLVEQPPVRERQTIDFNDATAVGTFEFSGVSIDLDPATNPLIAGATATAEEVAATIVSMEADIRNRDPRVASVVVDPTDSSRVLLTYSSSASDVEEVAINDAGAYILNGTSTSPASVSSDPDFSAIEQQAVRISAPTGAGTISVGGVTVAVSDSTTPPDTATDVVNRIVANQADIIAANPQIESITADNVNSRVLINYYSDEGDVNPLTITESVTGGSAAIDNEVQTLTVSNGTGVVSTDSEIQTLTVTNGTGVSGGDVAVAGLTIALGATQTVEQTADAIVAALQSEITNGTDGITQLVGASIGRSGANNEIITVTYADAADDINDSFLALTDTDSTGAAGTEAVTQPFAENGGDITVAGLTIPLAANLTAAEVATAIEAALQSEITNGTNSIAQLVGATVSVGGAGNDVVTVTYADAAGDINDSFLALTDTDSTGAAGTEAVTEVYSQVVTPGSTLAVGEIQSFEVAGPVGTAGTITVGGVAVTTLNDGDTALEVAQKIAAALNGSSTPPFGFLSAVAVGTKVVVEYAGSAGNVDSIEFADNASPTGASIGTVNIDKSYNQAETIVNGDTSHLGVYQMFAYLNGTELLDIGKEVAPGAPGSSGIPVSTEPGAVLLTFDTTNGVLSSVNGDTTSGSGVAPTITISGADPADPSNFVLLDITGTTQFASDSIVKTVTQDGYAKGDLIGVSFAEDGTMVASYSNGQNTSLGIVSLATFENQSGLQSVGDTEWSATLDSGQAILNPPGTGLNGLLSSGALEQSNVDLSEELVALIEAQRNFQANSKTLETENAITQTILQIS